MNATTMETRRAPGLRVKSGVLAGAIVCYDNSNGYLMPVWTPCSTGGAVSPTEPIPPAVSNVQWLDCRSCTGTVLGAGQLGPAQCEVCYTVG